MRKLLAAIQSIIPPLTLFPLFLSSILLLFPPSSFAQSMQVIGGSSYASDCYRASVMAVKFGKSSSQSVDSCNKALSYGKLKRMNRIATYVNRGVIYASLNRYKRALRDYQKAIELGDTVAETYLNRGNLWFIRKQWEKALADYEKSLSLNLELSEIAYLNRGMVKEQLGHYREAKADYLTALQQRPKWPDALDKLSRVTGKIGAAAE